MTEPTIAYQWRIERIEAAPALGELSDVVRRIHWRLLASDGARSTSTYGDVLLRSPDPADFVAFQDLTPEIVVEWLEGAINACASGGAPTVEQLRIGLAGVLSSLRTPAIAPVLPPWE